MRALLKTFIFDLFVIIILIILDNISIIMEMRIPWANIALVIIVTIGVTIITRKKRRKFDGK